MKYYISQRASDQSHRKSRLSSQTEFVARMYKLLSSPDASAFA